MAGFTIGQVAKEAGVGIETIRFYERRGLVPDPPRRPSGYRQYPEATVHRLRFIRRAKELGFSLGEIRELLTLRAESREACAKVRGQIDGKLRDLDERLRDLRRMRRALEELHALCDSTGSTGPCPFLDLLDEGSR